MRRIIFEASAALVAVKLVFNEWKSFAEDRSEVELVKQKLLLSDGTVPSREEQESKLSGSSSIRPLDILVVGGGATGSGVALDAATRGLRVGLVEREDFSSGTSSRSTKILHGGKSCPLFFSFLLFICSVGLSNFSL